MNTRKSGAEFEEMACQFLVSKDYVIRERNFHASKIGEIDVIANKDGIIYFVEVKGRNNNAYGSPAESIDFRKKQKLRLTAQYYLNKYFLSNIEYRFLIIEIFKEFDKYKINVIDEIFE